MRRCWSPAGWAAGWPASMPGVVPGWWRVWPPRAGRWCRASMRPRRCLEIARERMCAGDFRTADLEAVPFADASFDVVTGFNAFRFAGDPGRALAEARRVARPGGRVVVITWGDPEGMEAAAIVGAQRPLLPTRRPARPCPSRCPTRTRLCRRGGAVGRRCGRCRKRLTLSRRGDGPAGPWLVGRGCAGEGAGGRRGGGRCTSRGTCGLPAGRWLVPDRRVLPVSGCAGLIASWPFPSDLPIHR